MTVAKSIVSARAAPAKPGRRTRGCTRPPAARGRRAWSAWLITLAATAASTYALDAVATAAGVLLVASQLLSGLDHTRRARLPGRVVRAVGNFGLRANLRANWLLLRRTGTSTNVLSKAAFELAGRRGARARSGSRPARATSPTELAKEAPYYAGAFGAAVLTDAVSSNDALLFLAGANLGAAAYEYVLARLTRRLLPARGSCASFDTDWVPQEYLTDYYSVVEPDERETIAFFVDAMKAGPGRRAGAGLRHRADAPSRLPRRAEGLGAPPRRLPAREPRRDRALAHARPRRSRLARVRPLHARMRGRRGADRRGDHAARGAHPLEDHAAAPGRRAPPASRSTGATRRSSAPTARTPRPTIAPRGRR